MIFKLTKKFKQKTLREKREKNNALVGVYSERIRGQVQTNETKKTKLIKNKKNTTNYF